ncbi:hypothetical protein LZ017_17070 [Pelomonas sp. CA6]|uniref:hypothetical protein n=1 Tax=Pelomonas sp. CA6 TaxID=2907999 RepID=UPI001F4C2093|nr:hypothetical protein [Pelomonas sp. CA6]MCH7345096.1 hypothetical protein [Pelomonas sp. CA6]
MTVVSDLRSSVNASREPDWRGAARALLSGCVDLVGADLRLALMEQVCRGLGDALYPDFLTLLAYIGENGDAQVRAVVAAALLEGLQTGRIPSGRRQAWGGARTGSAAWRSLGPLEYLCAAQDPAARALLDANPPITADPSAEARFLREGQAMLRLLDSDDRARRLYIERLVALADDPLEGGLSRQARAGLQAMATAWRQGEGPDTVCRRYLEAVGADRSRPGPGQGLRSLFV